MGQHQLSEDRRHHALPIKKGDAETHLQVLEAAGQCRLGYPERRRYAAKVPVGRESLDQFKLTYRVHDSV